MWVLRSTVSQVPDCAIYDSGNAVTFAYGGSTAVSKQHMRSAEKETRKEGIGGTVGPYYSEIS